MNWSYAAIDAWNIPGFVLFSLLVLSASQSVGKSRQWWFLPSLLTAGVALRIFGSAARFELNRRYYGGSGDALEYFYQGIFRCRDYGGLLSAEYWFQGRWWGTMFLTRFSGLLTTIIGPTKLGEFLFFGMASFLGLTAIAVAFYKVQPGPEAGRLVHLIWLWPSLWFWPSSIGKEGLLIVAIGLATLGYAGHEQRINWLYFFLGLALAFSIRPHVAAVIAVATMGAHWLSNWQGLTARRVIEGFGILGIAFLSLRSMKEQLGFEANIEGVRDFVAHTAAQTQSGGSSIQAADLSLTGLPMAFANVWFRPLPWEAHSITALVASGELVLLWFLVWRRRKAFRMAIRYWRRHRLLQFAFPFLIIYTLMIGLSFANLGIIARQRAPLFPFMFMFLYAVPDEWLGPNGPPVEAPR